MSKKMRTTKWKWHPENGKMTYRVDAFLGVNVEIFNGDHDTSVIGRFNTREDAEFAANILQKTLEKVYEKLGYLDVDDHSIQSTKAEEYAASVLKEIFGDAKVTGMFVKDIEELLKQAFLKGFELNFSTLN